MANTYNLIEDINRLKDEITNDILLSAINKQNLLVKLNLKINN
jgi:hypothetical protein